MAKIMGYHVPLTGGTVSDGREEVAPAADEVSDQETVAVAASNEGASLLVTSQDSAGNEPADAAAQPKRKLTIRWGLLTLGLIILLLVAYFKVLFGPEESSTAVWGFWGEVFSLFFAEIGVALIVSFIVAFFIDRQSREAEMTQRERDNKYDRSRREFLAKEHEEREKLIAKDVIQGVYGLRHKPSYVKAVLDSTLQSNIVRKSIELDYTLSELDSEQIETVGVDDPSRFVMINMDSSYEFENLSNQDIPFDVRYQVAVRHGPGARELSGVTELTVGGKEFSPAEINAGLVEDEDEDENSRDKDDKSYAWPHVIKAGGKLAVAVTVQSVKERSDNEAWGSFFGTIDGAKIRFQVLNDMVFGVRPLTSSELSERSRKPTWGTWESDGPILPYNSVVFWWRTPADDGQ